MIRKELQEVMFKIGAEAWDGISSLLVANRWYNVVS